jgi:ABC-2 type transport system ATP-binding protein
VTGAAPAIRIEGLVKRYAGRPVVDGLDLEVPAGAIVALLGPNGAGKTTTVEVVEGYRSPDAGRVSVLGLDPTRDGRRLRPRLGLMLQEGGIYPQARPRELLRLYGRFYRDARDPDRLLETVGLERAAETRWRRLSGGERQRLSLALAIVGRPDVLVLDEPTAGMDPAAKAATRELVASLRDEGASILLTTHELSDVERLADRIAIIDRGRLVLDGTPAELMAGARPRLRMRFDAPLAPEALVSLSSAIAGPAVDAAYATSAESTASGVAGGHGVAGDASVVQDGGGARYAVEGAAPSPAVIARVATWAESTGRLLVELRASGGTLEERYLELVGPDGVADEGATATAGPTGGAPRAGRRGGRVR